MFKSLTEFLTHFSLTLPAKEAKNWRAIPADEQVINHLRGQPHMGDVIPCITDGVHAYVIRLSDGLPYEVHCTNLTKWKSVLRAIKREDDGKKFYPRKRRVRSFESLLDDFS